MYLYKVWSIILFNYLNFLFTIKHRVFMLQIFLYPSTDNSKNHKLSVGG